jgi:hypothetical protein
MKKFILILLLSILFFQGRAQNIGIGTENDRYLRLIRGSDNSLYKRIELSSDIDTSWNKWKLRGYNYGFNPAQTPMYTTVNGILSTPYMIQVRGNGPGNERNMKRWGYHVFEGYAADDISRLTMLVNKHIEEGKPVSEIYYYGSVYGHSSAAYNWIKLGSDVRQHSFMFSRDKAIFYGSLNLRNVLTLGNIGKDDVLKQKPSGDDETNYADDARFVNYTELKTAGNGSLFYDKDNNIVVIKINGEWMKLVVEKLPENISYDFK